MNSSRRFHRIDLSSEVSVTYGDKRYNGMLGAISLGGAAINFNGSTMIPENDDCVVCVSLDEKQPPLELQAKITNSSISRIGVAFVNMDETTRESLFNSLTRLSCRPESLAQEYRLLIALS